MRIDGINPTQGIRLTASVQPENKIQPQPFGQEAQPSSRTSGEKPFTPAINGTQDPSRPAWFPQAQEASPKDPDAEEKTEGKSQGADKPEKQDSSKGKTSENKELSKEEQEEVRKLKLRDTEVQTHEQAHLAAAGPYARGGIHYDYQTGPDGGRYRVGGHVNIDTGEEKDPQATIQKAQVIYRAALAPAEPSSQDRAVAREAKNMENRARQRLQEEGREKAETSEQPGKISAQAQKAYDTQMVSTRKMGESQSQGFSLDLAA